MDNFEKKRQRESMMMLCLLIITNLGSAFVGYNYGLEQARHWIEQILSK